MEFLSQLLNYFLHLDVELTHVIETFGLWTYAILFVVIFCETGLVVLPFLPGDSLLFAAGAFAAMGSFDLPVLLLVLYLAPACGDSTNYWIGRFVGPKVFHKEHVRFLNKEYLEKTHRFYEKHGGKTIIIARFMPIFRTFAPFVAGIGRMSYLRFVTFSIGGTLLWISTFVFGGYFFGNIPIVKRNFTLVIFAIIAISAIPAAVGYIKHRLSQRSLST